MRQYIDCGECGGNAPLALRTVRWVIGDSLLIIKNVPCYKCTQCGEVLFDSTVLKVVNKIINNYAHIVQNTEVGYQAA